MSAHTEQHPHAGKSLKIKTKPDPDNLNGQSVTIKDWVDREWQMPWSQIEDSDDTKLLNMATEFIMRVSHNGLPMDDNVVIGNIGCKILLVHETELEEPEA